MRARIRFSKAGPLRYVGHLDLQTLWERAARRAQLPLAYSHGFHPQPKITFASALPLGYSSRAEMLDMRLEEDIEISELPPRLNEALPRGLVVLDAQAVDEAAPALQMLLSSAEFEVTLIERLDGYALQQRIRGLLQEQQLPRTRRGKAYDLRLLIEDLRLMEAVNEDASIRILMRLSARESATGRPEEVLDALGIGPNDARIERSRLIFQGETVE